MLGRRLNRVCLSVLFASTALTLTFNEPKSAQAAEPTVIEANTRLDPNASIGPLIIKASNITIDGRGICLTGSSTGKPKDFKGIAITATGVTNITLKNITAKGWETGLKLVDCAGVTVENCDFSDNFHDPDFGWGENGRRGGMVLERVTKSTLRKNKANRVWDACVLVDSNDNVLEDNDFSHTSNTCLKLWTACRNTIRKNVLSHGIRISPGEVHARDSTSVLIESGSNNNTLLNNDCTHGGDGIFVRVLNGWCSINNRFEGNDCSYANNNGVECWAPHNVFVGNKANHCSYGFWMGGSDDTQLIRNEASFNGLVSGHHNSPHLPQNGHAGIVFMFGPSSHTLAQGNLCEGNNGAGIALIGDLASQGRKWRAYHWVAKQNVLTGNRWGFYAKHADWVTLAGNEYQKNSVQDVMLDGDVTRFTESTKPILQTRKLPLLKINGPTAVKIGTKGTWDAQIDQGATNDGLTYAWDIEGGQLQSDSKIEHTFHQVGFHRIGLNVSNGESIQLAWHNVYAVRDVEELGTDGHSADWSIEDFHDRTRSNQQTSRAAFNDDTSEYLVGKSAVRVVIRPYAGFRAALTYPKSRDAKWPANGKTKLVFWLKAINEDVTGWQGGPFITLHDADNQRCHIEPKPGLDLMRQLDHNEAREGWQLMEIPLSSNEKWQVDGTVPSTIQAVSLAFDSWGAPTLRFWIDGLAFE